MIPAAVSASTRAPLVLHAADEVLLKHVLGDTRVVRKPSGPELTDYFGALAHAFVRWLKDVFHARPSLAENLTLGVEILALAAVGLGLGLLAVAALRRARAFGGPRGPAAPRRDWTEAAGRPAALDRAAWRREIESRLKGGDVAGALEALWWWLAASLTVDEAIDESWTTRELLVRARRPELLRAGFGLDALMYGRTSPSAADVGACLARFEEKLR
jgi:hypothetical protein